MKTRTFSGIYISGFPKLNITNISCIINLTEKEIVVTHKNKTIFKIPYEKINRIVTKTEKTQTLGSVLANILFPLFLFVLFLGLTGIIGGILGIILGVILVAFFGNPKRKSFIIYVEGKDKEGNKVEIPIVFKNIKKDSLLKREIEFYISHTKDITI